MHFSQNSALDIPPKLDAAITQFTSVFFILNDCTPFFFFSERKQSATSGEEKEALIVETETTHMFMNCNPEVVKLPSQFSKIEGLQISRRVTVDNSTRLEKIVDFYPYYPLHFKKDIYVRFYPLTTLQAVLVIQ